MRGAFSSSLVKHAKANPKILLLTGDHGYALFDEFRKQCPSQYINAGIAEQNMVGMAAGLAKAGFIPVVYGLSAFVPLRVVEQMKIDVCHDNLHVVFMGDGAGFVYSHLGTSHQSAEDMACTRALPNLNIFSPADRFEMTACMDMAFNKSGPAYIRMGKSDLGDVHSAEPENLESGKLINVKKGESGLTFIATGSMVRTALDLLEDFEGAGVWSVPFIKPMDAKQVAQIAKQSSVIVTLEEHSIYGGLGSEVAEIVSQYCPTKILRIGIADRFTEHCGSYKYLLKEHKLDRDSIKNTVSEYLAHAKSDFAHYLE